MSSCIFTGSFDPFTIGHLDIAISAAKVFDKVYVAVLNNEFKATMFNMNERVEIAKAAVMDYPAIEVVSHSGTAVELAEKLDVNAIVRGIRNTADLNYEQEMSFINGQWNIETVFMLSSYPYISSTAARQLITYGGSLDKVLTKQQIEILKTIKI